MEEDYSNSVRDELTFLRTYSDGYRGKTTNLR